MTEAGVGDCCEGAGVGCWGGWGGAGLGVGLLEKSQSRRESQMEEKIPCYLGPR